MNDRRNDRDRSTGDNGDFQDAVKRLEQAVQELVNTAKDRFSDRAASFIDDTTAKLKSEFGPKNNHRSSGEYRASGPRRERPQQRSRRLYMDPQNQKIAGVCAGIANYYGMEPWLVRIIAVTGLVFLPSIVFPGYWILFFFMGNPPKSNGRSEEVMKARRDHSSPAPELGARLSPRHSLRNISVDIAQAELRLRRIESHVTSTRFELQRELAKIDEPPRTV